MSIGVQVCALPVQKEFSGERALGSVVNVLQTLYRRFAEGTFIEETAQIFTVITVINSMMMVFGRYLCLCAFVEAFGHYYSHYPDLGP